MSPNRFRRLLTSLVCIWISVYLAPPAQAIDCLPTQHGTLAGCNLRGDFSNYDFSNSTFVDVDFKGANIKGANFANSKFTRAIGIVAENANFDGAKLISSFLGPNDLSECDKGSSFEGSTFVDTIFYETGFNCVTFSEKALSSFKMMGKVTCNLMNNNPLPAYTIYVQKGSRSNGKPVSCTDGGLFYGFSKNNDWISSDWQTGLDFSEWDFSFADLTGSRFIGVNLTNALFNGSNLTNVDFEGSTFGYKSFENSNLQGVELSKLPTFPLGFCFQIAPASIPESGRILGNCLVNKYGGSELVRANFAKLDLSGVSLLSCLNCNLQAAQLDNFNTGNLSGSDLRNAKIEKLDLTTVNLAFANLSGLNLSKRKFASDLGGANITSANLSNADVRKALFTGATLTGANVSSTYFPSNSESLLLIKTGNLKGTPKTLPKLWKVINGYLVGPGADLSSANLQNQDLTGISLDNSNLDKCKLKGSKLLPKIGGYRIQGTPSSLPTGWIISKGRLVRK